MVARRWQQPNARFLFDLPDVIADLFSTTTLCIRRGLSRMDKQQGVSCEAEHCEGDTKAIQISRGSLSLLTSLLPISLCSAPPPISVRQSISYLFASSRSRCCYESNNNSNSNLTTSTKVEEKQKRRKISMANRINIKPSPAFS